MSRWCPPILHPQTAASSQASLEIHRGEEAEEEEGGEGGGGEQQGPQIHQGASEEKGEPSPPLPRGQRPQEAARWGVAPTPLQAPADGILYPHLPCPTGAIDAPSAGTLHVSEGLLDQNPAVDLGRKGMWQGSSVHSAGWGARVGLGQAPRECGRWWLTRATSSWTSFGSKKLGLVPPTLQPRGGSVPPHAVSGTGHVQCATGHQPRLDWHPRPQHHGHGGMGAVGGSLLATRDGLM